MNKNTIELLSAAKDNVLKNQELRKQQRVQEMNKLVEEAKENTASLDYCLFDAILRGYIEAKANSKDEYSISYDNIGYPKEIQENNHKVDAYIHPERPQALAKFVDLVDPRQLELAQSYNENHPDNCIAFAIYVNDEGRLYAVPTFFDKKAYYDFGIDFQLFSGVTMSALINVERISLLIDKVLLNGYDNNTIINQLVFGLIQSTHARFKDKEQVMERYTNKCAENKSFLEEIIIANFLSQYHREQLDSYSITLSHMRESAYQRELSPTDFKDITDYTFSIEGDPKKSDYRYHACFVEYLDQNGQLRYIPLLKGQEEEIARENGFECAFSNYKNTVITTTVENLERLIEEAFKQAQK